MSCNGPVERAKMEYFDMEGLVGQQINILNELNPELKKIASINGVNEEQVSRFDSAGWASELNIFLEADINKPKLTGNYETKVFNEDNKTIVLYKALDPGDVQVEFLKIIYTDEKLSKIESQYIEKNMLYSTRRNLQMNFLTDKPGEPVLADYKIQGKQKMMMKDTIHYFIESSVLF